MHWQKKKERGHKHMRQKKTKPKPKNKNRKEKKKKTDLGRFGSLGFATEPGILTRDGESYSL